MKPGLQGARQKPKETFVNPYTFVPLPEIPGDSSSFCRPPAGHDHLATDRYSGSVDVELTARSPLLLRGVRPGETGFPRRRFEETGDEPVPFIPGSSLAGMVRSRHELIAGGCLRILDVDFRPGYRDAVKPRHDGWKLAVVGPVGEDGKPETMRMCTEVVWADAAELAEALGGPRRW